jgi:hypothetical protein
MPKSGIDVKPALKHLPPMPAGRPSDYSEELGDAICAKLIDDTSLRQVALLPEFPDRSTILRWLDKHPEFAAKYARAREVQGDVLDDEMQREADEASVDDWQVRKLRIETMKWRASKLAPKRYGDKLALAGPDGGPLQVVVQKFTEPTEGGE